MLGHSYSHFWVYRAALRETRAADSQPAIPLWLGVILRANHIEYPHLR